MIPWAHVSQFPKRHLDRFSRFCRPHERDQQTDTQTTQRATYAAIDRIYVLHACDAD